ncbi:MAG TPA: hypothetical protein VMV13_13460 [Candidatus Binataceae bacterium]|nr:hypothetical protein [Candidatus Binataceae bacterium]
MNPPTAPGLHGCAKPDPIVLILNFTGTVDGFRAANTPHSEHSPNFALSHGDSLFGADNGTSAPQSQSSDLDELSIPI